MSYRIARSTLALPLDCVGLSYLYNYNKGTGRSHQDTTEARPLEGAWPIRALTVI